MVLCKTCGKKIVKGEDFVLIGKYPSGLMIWIKNIWNWLPPEEYGEIHHKACFIEALKKENV